MFTFILFLLSFAFAQEPDRTWEKHFAHPYSS